MMVGRAVQLVVDKETREPGPPALEVATSWSATTADTSR